MGCARLLLAQYCDGGPLDRAVRQGRFAGDLASLYLCLMDIAAGMTYLHALGIVHRRAFVRSEAPHRKAACAMHSRKLTWLSAAPLPMSAKKGMS
jgi:hypothetical protein